MYPRLRERKGTRLRRHLPDGTVHVPHDSQRQTQNPSPLRQWWQGYIHIESTVPATNSAWRVSVP